MSGVSQFKYNAIPPINEVGREHILDLEEVRKLPLFSDPKLAELGLYSLHRYDNAELTEYLQPFFDYDITGRVFYQIVGKELPIHKDLNRKTATNCIIGLGGDDVYTNWYDEDKNLINSVKIKQYCWNTIDVGSFHDVTGQTSDRYGLTVFLLEE